MAFMMISGITRASAQPDTSKHRTVLDFTMTSIDGKDVPLSTYKGKVLLLVNVASKCGQTPQYAQLEELHKKYSGKGLAILGFPANNFGSQEPGTDEQIKEFCSATYGVTFDMFSKISVKGNDQHPLYQYLTAKETNPGFAGDVKWNFTKYLVSRDGTVVNKFASGVKPMSEELVSAIEAALQ
jgi:glutathione peroxidase